MSKTGLFQQGFWFLPEYVPLDDIQLRLDSLVFTYSCAGNNNCNESVVSIKEVFSVKNGPKIVQNVGEWSPGLVSIAEPYIWHRRTDLKQSEVIAVGLQWKPISILIGNETSGLQFDGYSPTIFNRLTSIVNLKVRTV